MRYSNPILPGFRPDPSICRVGDTFYMVNSSFEYFPGIPLYESRDLINWTQIGHVLTRNSQLKLACGEPNRLGIYAPTIRYGNGRFYCIVTNVGGEAGGNFFVYTDDIHKEWSEPVRLEFGGIDPSLFFDDDGKVYYSGTDGGIFICEIDIETGSRIGERHYECWNGSGGSNPEGPHLYKIGGRYYLMIAEGGTELCHMETIARADSIYGPYEACPYNPVLTNHSLDLPIKAVGHADLVEDTFGRTWAVCLGIRPCKYPFVHILGRETMLVPVEWKDGWPVFGNGGRCDEEYELDREIPGSRCEAAQNGETSDSRRDCVGGYRPGSDMCDDFSGTELHPSWNYIYNPEPGLVNLTGEGLKLRCAKHLNEDAPKAILARRQESLYCEAETRLVFKAADGSEQAGMTVYENAKHHYELGVSADVDGCFVFVNRRIGSLEKRVGEARAAEGPVNIRLVCEPDRYIFLYKDSDMSEFRELGSGETAYLATETGGCFTGNYIALYACSDSGKSKTEAVFTRFGYRRTTR